MRFPNDAELKVLRERYPAGTVIRMINMEDNIAPVPCGTIGRVVIIDDAGSIHMNWENGSGGRKPLKEEVSSRERHRGNLGLSGDQHYLHVAAVRDLPTVAESDGGRSWKASMQSEVFAVYSQARGKE